MNIKTSPAIFLAFMLLATLLPADEPLPSLNNTTPKKAILTFVEKVTKEGSTGFVPAEERIATFDNDGTLWAEQISRLISCFST